MTTEEKIQELCECKKCEDLHLCSKNEYKCKYHTMLEEMSRWKDEELKKRLKIIEQRIIITN